MQFQTSFSTPDGIISLMCLLVCLCFFTPSLLCIWIKIIFFALLVFFGSTYIELKKNCKCYYMPHRKLYSVAFFGPKNDATKNILSQSLTSNSVQEHEVLEIGDLAALPLLRHVWVAHELARRHHRRASVNNNTHFNDYVFDSTNQDNWTETCFLKKLWEGWRRTKT